LQHYNEENVSKNKFHPRTGLEDPEGEWKYSCTLSLTTAVDGVGGQRHASAALPRERPGTHRIGGWAGPKAGLDGRENVNKPKPNRNVPKS
jgi:hypothetical protein